MVPVMMRTFSLSVEDDRLGVPVRSMYMAADEDRSREIAQAKLQSSPNFRAVEVGENGHTLFRLERT